MTGKALWEQYQHYTRDFTDHARKLGFAGLGVCWLFHDERFRFPWLIYGAIFLFVCYFVCDALQNLLAALTLRLFTENREKKLWRETGSIEGEIPKPKWVDGPASVMFAAKAVFLLGGFVVVGLELLRRLSS
jgi:hypothetical protein